MKELYDKALRGTDYTQEQALALVIEYILLRDLDYDWKVVIAYSHRYGAKPFDLMNVAIALAICAVIGFTTGIIAGML